MMDIVEFYSNATITAWAMVDYLESRPGPHRTTNVRYWRGMAVHYLNQVKYWEKRA